MIALQIIFWVSLFLILYSYLLFPGILRLIAGNRAEERYAPPVDEELPRLSVLIAAHNEEEVIGSKIESLLASDYPSGKMEILVGSDASTDDTDRIIKHLEEKHSSVKAVMFGSRTGKPGIINHLAGLSGAEILVITDANVMVERGTLRQLAGSFRDPGVGLVDTRMINTRLKRDGISHQEKYYINREVRIKHHESLIWGAMMGPFGGCYAVRRSLFRPVPGNFLVDDFYINMSVLKEGFRCKSNPEAVVYEDVSNELSEEYRRKKRIAAGNFQNLRAFGSMLFSGLPGVSFCFFSHKVIRWLVPVLFLLTLGCSILLGREMPLYRIFAWMQLSLLLIPVIDHFLRKIKIHALPLRFVTHFIVMNLALLTGLINYLGGIRNNVWQPTRRNQDQA